MIDWTKPLELVRDNGVVWPIASAEYEPEDQTYLIDLMDHGTRWTGEDGRMLAFPEFYVRNREPVTPAFETHPDFGKSVDFAPAETLRDRFAMAALTGLLASGDYSDGGIGPDEGSHNKAFAKAAYSMADTMMAERNG